MAGVAGDGARRGGPGAAPGRPGAAPAPLGAISEVRRAASQGPTPVDVPTPSLPKGGGAIRPIAEKFSANPATGAGSFSVPIAMTAGRSGFGPALGLIYDSGAGNGPFGLGWSLSLPSVSRKTEKGLPQYRDREESDTFVLSGAEDLVPALKPNGDGWTRDIVTVGPLRRERYRPRVEAEFARIERVTDTDSGAVHWEVTTRDNVRSIFGRGPDARIADPANRARVFRWLLEETRDDRGNVVRYEYKAEDRAGVPRSLPERHRLAGDEAPFASRYLKRVLYGNRHGVADPAAPEDFHFEIVLDYGEHDDDAPAPDDGGTWSVRADAFSSYRSGFEIRTYRLCRRLLMFHRFAELGAGPVLVRSTDFEYEEGPSVTYLRRVTHRGYAPTETGYDALSLPSVTLDYSRAELESDVRMLDRESLRGAPQGADGRSYQWVDLDGEGIAGLLTQQAGALYYKPNLGQGRLAPPRALRTRPSVARLGAAAIMARGAGTQQLVDVTGDGLPDLVCLGGPAGGGFHARTEEGDWGPYRAFQSVPNVDWSDPSLRFIDLDGDGFADVVLSEGHVYTWYPSLRERGYGPARQATRFADEDKGPTVVFAEAEQTVFLADMSGDGLQDLVRIRNGSICYWPNLGYGRFGARVAMDGAPAFAPSNLFDPRRIRLADIDGSGTADLIYVGADGVDVWMNLAGNGFGARTRLAVFPSHDALSSVDVVDLLGTGTGCLVWSTPLRGMPPELRYVDLLGSRKPHLLVTVRNGIGLETRVAYAPSTRFYLEDKEAGTPWATRLPFPVQVVLRVEHYDHLARHRFVSTYRYRHGYYDAEEREFRGFGYVETRDAERVGADLGKGLFPDYPVENGERPLPPVVTKSWFHTGAWTRGQPLRDRFALEWFTQEGAPLPRLVMPAMPEELSPIELHQAHRALAGRILRQEVYAEDGTDAAGTPYTVTEKTWAVRRVQPTDGAPFAVFLPYERESFAMTMERNPLDPRIAHSMALEVDELGYVRKSASVAYGRELDGSSEQRRTWVSVVEHDVKHDTAEPTRYRHGVPLSSASYEMGAALAPDPGALLAPEAVRAACATYATVPFDATVGASEKRLLAESRERYWNDDASAPLAFGDCGLRALPYESYALALTPGLLSGPLDGHIDAALATTEGGYVDLDADGRYFARSGAAHPNAAAFYQPDRVADAFGNVTTLDYDAHKLAVVRATDALGNVVLAGIDYLQVQPWKVTDPNGNWAEAAFDALGRVTAIASRGKNGEGDTLAAPTSRFTYELHRFESLGKPVRVTAERRETHQSPTSRWLVSHAYSDGAGRALMTKVKVEPGPAPVLGPDGIPVKDAGGAIVYADANPRYVGTGRTVRDNKGNPIKQYEPFFSATPEYEDDAAVVEWGVTPLLHYDALGRLVRTDFPDGSYSRLEHATWQQSAWDQNDTVLEAGNLWQAAHAGTAEATKAAVHAGTPTVTHLDALGRGFRVVEWNRTMQSPPDDAWPTTTSTYDIQGNALAVRDAKDRVCMTYAYGPLGQVLRQTSIDAGTRWSFATAAGEPVRTWGQRGFVRSTRYDALRRPSHVFVQEGSGPDVLVERLVYGELHADVAPKNLRGRLVAHYDQSGARFTDRFDFESNLLEQRKRLATSYDALVDLSALASLTDPAAILAAAEGLLETEAFAHAATYDALGRPKTVTTPDQSIVTSTYNDAGLLEKVTSKLRGAASATTIVSKINYDEKGRRTKITYGSGIQTTYMYDPLTFRLTGFMSKRSGPPPKFLQKLAYSYDPVGNIVATRDTADQDSFFSASNVPSPDASYTYDAFYRLIAATGREHAAGADAQLDEQGLPILAVPHPNDPSGLRRYSEEYLVDEVGNFTEMRHRLDLGGLGEWTRTYSYVDGTNRLATTSHGSLGPRSYAHDAHGNMSAMPHLAAMGWDYGDQLRTVDLGGGGTVHFVYDATGERARKVWIHAGYRDERIYLGGYEVFRRTVIATETLQDERQTLHIADDARRVAMAETLTVSGGTPVPSPVPRLRCQLDDHLGTACIETDQAGLVITYEQFHPFGTSACQSVKSGVEVSAKRYRYVGKERDEETSLYAMGARYYAPWLGRWTAADPLWGADGVNLYQYCRGSPIGLRDPGGTAPLDEQRVKEFAQGKAAPDVSFQDDPLQASGPGRVGLKGIDKPDFGEVPPIPNVEDYSPKAWAVKPAPQAPAAAATPAPSPALPSTAGAGGAPQASEWENLGITGSAADPSKAVQMGAHPATANAIIALLMTPGALAAIPSWAWTIATLASTTQTQSSRDVGGHVGTASLAMGMVRPIPKGGAGEPAGPAPRPVPEGAPAPRLGAKVGQEIGILHDAARGSGNFGLGVTDTATAERLGEAWVGPGAKLASDGKTLVSADGLRQFRPPSFKPNLGRFQANFERRFAPSGSWNSNGHLDITLGPRKP